MLGVQLEKNNGVNFKGLNRDGWEGSQKSLQLLTVLLDRFDGAIILTYFSSPDGLTCCGPLVDGVGT